MSDILDQIAGIKQLLQEQAEDCAQQCKYEQERREIDDKAKNETEMLEASAREELEKVRRAWEASHQDGMAASSPDVDALMRLIQENHKIRMRGIHRFFQNCSTSRNEERTELLNGLSRLGKTPTSS